MWGIVGRIIIVFFICSILISGVQARYYDDSDHQDICSPDDGHIAHEAAMLTIDALNTASTATNLNPAGVASTKEAYDKAFEAANRVNSFNVRNLLTKKLEIVKKTLNQDRNLLNTTDLRSYLKNKLEVEAKNIDPDHYADLAENCI